VAELNVKPEVVTAIVNHRISVASSVDELQHEIIKTLSPVAGKLGIDVEAWGKVVDVEQFAAKAGCHGSGMGVFGHKGGKHKGPKTGKLVIGTAWNST